MERIVNVHVERLPEGLYLATSDDIQGLVAQGRTVAEALEIARDVARKLLEEQKLDGSTEAPRQVMDRADFPVVVET